MHFQDHCTADTSGALCHISQSASDFSDSCSGKFHRSSDSPLACVSFSLSVPGAFSTTIEAGLACIHAQPGSVHLPPSLSPSLSASLASFLPSFFCSFLPLYIDGLFCMYQEMFTILEIALSLILYKTEPEAKIEIVKFHLGGASPGQ